MRIERLTIHDFLGIEAADLDFERLTFIFGRNGAGKSSVRDAILYALTGRARSTDAAGRGADRLVRVGATGCRVALAARQDGAEVVLQRERSARGGAYVGPSLPQDPDTIEAALDVPRILTVDAKDRSELLSRLICPPLSIQEVVDEAARAGAPASICQSLAAGLAKCGERIGPEQLKEAHERVYARRRDAKRDLEAARARLAALGAREVPDPAQLADAAERVAQLDRELAVRRQEAGSLVARADELHRLVEEQVRLNAEADELRKPAVALTWPAGEEPAALEQLAVQAQREIDLRVRSLAEAEADRAKAWKEHAGLLRDIQAAKTGEVACDGRHGAGTACPISEAWLKDAKAALPKWTEAEAIKLEHLGRLTELQRAAAEAVTHAQDAARIAQAKAEEAQRKVAESKASDRGRLEQIEARLVEIEARIDEIGDVEGAALEAADALMALKGQLAGAQDLQRRLDAAAAAAEEIAERTKAVAKGELQVEQYEHLVKLLDPKGLPARIVAGRIGPFVEAVNDILGTVCPEYGISVEAGPKGLELVVFWVPPMKEARVLPAENLSTSERLRLGFALAQAICALTGLPLVIDDAEILDAESRAGFNRALADLDERIESVVVIATVDEPKLSSGPGRAVYWVEAGTVRRVGAGGPEPVAAAVRG